MIRRLTIACGLLTLAVVLGLALHDHSLFGARHGHRSAVTAIPDKPPVKPIPPAPPLKGRPPAPQPQPMHQQTAGSRPAAPSALQHVVNIANTIINLPKILNDQTQVKPGD